MIAEVTTIREGRLIASVLEPKDGKGEKLIPVQVGFPPATLDAKVEDVCFEIHRMNAQGETTRVTFVTMTREEFRGWLADLQNFERSITR